MSTVQKDFATIQGVVTVQNALTEIEGIDPAEVLKRLSDTVYVLTTYQQGTSLRLVVILSGCLGNYSDDAISKVASAISKAYPHLTVVNNSSGKEVDDGTKVLVSMRENEKPRTIHKTRDQWDLMTPEAQRELRYATSVDRLRPPKPLSFSNFEDKGGPMNKHALLEFTYDKGDGDVTERHGLIVSRPSDLYLIIETTDATIYKRWYSYLAEREVLDEWLKHKYGVKDLPYKNFKVEKMSQLVETKVEVTPLKLEL